MNEDEVARRRDHLYSKYDHDALDSGYASGREGFMARMAELDAIDESWAKGFVEWVYGQVYTRRVLDPKTRELCAVGEHVVLGNDRAMTTHMKAALRYGATPEEVREVCLHTAVYNGFPMAHHGLEMFDKALAAHREEFGDS
jgi:alkylhydroperoxidase/carboxymuconolactone decarboxylase family protein YurZ